MVEKEIATAVVAALLEAGFYVSIDNGDNNGNDFELENSRHSRTILGAMFQTDEETLFVYTTDGNQYGWVFFVYGNDGWDVISDYTVNLEKFIGKGTPVQKVIDKYAD
jgi:hypothetical protein